MLPEANGRGSEWIGATTVREWLETIAPKWEPEERKWGRRPRLRPTPWPAYGGDAGVRYSEQAAGRGGPAPHATRGAARALGRWMRPGAPEGPPLPAPRRLARRRFRRMPAGPQHRCRR